MLISVVPIPVLSGLSRGMNGVVVTKNRKAKSAARNAAKALGVSYSAALQMQAGGQQGGGSARSALSDAVTSALDGLEYTPVDEVFSVELMDVWLELPGAGNLSEPEVHDVVWDQDTLITDVAEVFEGGTSAVSGSCIADVWVDGVMAKGDVAAWSGPGVVVVLDADLTAHDSEVSLSEPVRVQFEFTAIVDGVSVEDFTLLGAGLPD